MNEEEKPDELDEIFQTEDSEEDLLAECSNQDVIKLQQEILIDINNLSIAVTSLGKRFDYFEKSIEKSKVTTEALASLSLEIRKLQENFHDREVLLPMFQSLISIADRDREQIARVKKHKEQSEDSFKPPAEQAFNFMLKAREADITEIHAALARFGVEPFTEDGDTFNPSRQKVIQRIETQDKELSQKIAKRLHPGYIRGEQIIRREYVSVYYLKS
jgi:molecular chaperone GrpE